MHTFCIILLGSLLMVATMTLAWEFVRRTKNGGLADVIWTFGLGAVAVIFSLAPLAGDVPTGRKTAAVIMILLWTAKLGKSLWQRNVGGAEDARYTAFRDKWGDAFMQHLFGLLMMQAVGAILLSLAVMLAAHNPMPWGILDAFGIVWILVALGGSYVADRQLAAFKKDASHKGKICDAGLWSRSRHPNYFFEAMFWAGWVFLALSGGWLPGLLALGAPLFIYWLLRYISGEPMVEELMAKKYGEAFQNYCKRVPPFFPRLF